SVDHLIELTSQAIEDEAWRQCAQSAGPAFVNAGYTWDHIAQRLVEAIRRCETGDNMGVQSFTDAPLSHRFPKPTDNGGTGGNSGSGNPPDVTRRIPRVIYQT